MVLAGLAALISNLDNDHDLVPFFVGLTVLGGIETWAVQAPFVGQRRVVARGAALIWAGAAAWVGVLLVMSVTVWQASSPPPGPEATYVGLPATIYHLVGLYGGAAFMLAAAFAADGWLGRFGSQRHASGEASP
jgi:hypothetical protein